MLFWSVRKQCMTSNQKFALISCCALPPLLAGAVLLLTWLGGPSDDGVRCVRSPTEAQCTVRRTRFLGLFGNTSYSIPESAIRGVKSTCGASHVGGRSGPSCNVYLIVDYGQFPDILIASYVFAGEANTAAGQLNHYLNDKSAKLIEIDESTLEPVLFFGAVPILLVVLVYVALR